MLARSKVRDALGLTGAGGSVNDASSQYPINQIIIYGNVCMDSLKLYCIMLVIRNNLKSLKKILFPIFSAFLLFRVFELMRQPMRSTPSLSILACLFFAFLITLYITGVFAFLGFAFDTNRLLSDRYYEITRPKLLSDVYSFLGVKYFKNILLVAFWGKKKNKAKYFDGTTSGLQNLIYQSKQSEFGHITAFYVINLFSMVLLVFDYALLPFFMFVINIIGNLYPVILQRHHRKRIDKLSSKLVHHE
ncbi:MAG: hypothetical protein ACI9JN_000546 [Bacteroidia bacterium]